MVTAVEPVPAESLMVSAPAEVTVAVAQLLIGRALQFPMHDPQGLLLLAEGAVITPEFKRLLEARQIASVKVGAEDAAAFDFAFQTRPRASTPFTPEFDSQASQQMQETVSRWLSSGANRGMALRQRVARHGTIGYDRELATEVRQQNLRSTAALTMMMNLVEHGRLNQVASSAFTTVQSSMKLLLTDIDGLMAQRIVGCPDSQLARHCLRMSQLAMAMAIEMGLNAENVQKIGITGLLHDWGQLRIPEAIRNGDILPNRWDRLELERHVSYSADLLDKLDGIPTMVSLISYQVHEKLNGTGYPRRKTEPNIHLFARILHVADDYVTLTTPMGWRPAVMPYAAIAGMLQQAHGRAADPTVLRALLRVLSLFPIGSAVQLSDGSEAVVIRSNGDRYTKPIVRQTTDADGKTVPETSPDAILNLADCDLEIRAALESFGEEELRYVPDPYVTYRVDTAAAAVPTPKWLGHGVRSRRTPGTDAAKRE